MGTQAAVRYDMKRKLLTVLATLVAIFFALEMGARFYQGIVRGRTLEDSVFSVCYRDYYLLGMSFRPSSECDWQDMHMSVNSLGFRGPSVTVEKPDQVVRIVAFGASTSTAGNYPAKLRSLLNQRGVGGDKRVEVIDAAVPGWTTTQSLVQFVSRAIHLDPDIILVYHAINDANMSDTHWFESLPEVDYTKFGGPTRRYSQFLTFLGNRWTRFSTARKVRGWERGLDSRAERNTAGKQPQKTGTRVFEADLTNFVVIAKSRGIRVGLITMPLNHAPEETYRSNAERAGYFYDDFEHYVSRVRQFNESTRRIARAQGATLIDAAASPLYKDKTNFVDLVHFTEQGADAFTREVVSAVSELVSAATGSPPSVQ